MHDAKVEYVWGGTLDFAFDIMPHAGQMDGMYYSLGYAGHGVAMATLLGKKMAEAILKNKHKILPCAAYLQGEYDIHDLFVGVPCQLGQKGLEKIIQIKMTPEEHAALIEPIRDDYPPLFDVVTPIPFAELQKLLDESAPWGILAYEKALYLSELSDAAIAVFTEYLPKKQSPLSLVPVFQLIHLTQGEMGVSRLRQKRNGFC